ncbi:2OG-Fe(II) oxygenase [Paraburkholderia strydomiana]|uniref:2OG-Fe(II) oxygenase n=1 Tax=Paraburkholderia strydomiana TaxID=1245417 RepID=UPI001BE64AB9|nr:2OG-Fe(II) oxygenase [Paraburkholderia strydomiana]MBT2795304.1 2OG-Fe(II) oxygenase [Paraburkholderia strydomiana]
MAMHDAQLLTPARVGPIALPGFCAAIARTRALSTPQQAFAKRIEALRIALNRDLFLGLVDSESDYAVYRPGAGYARHVDCLRNNDSRVISAVFYLNEAWQDAEGGALRLYLADQSYHDVFPRAGTLLLFLSAQFEHEVLPAARDRMSIACWMRQRLKTEVRTQRWLTSMITPLRIRLTISRRISLVPISTWCRWLRAKPARSHDIAPPAAGRGQAFDSVQERRVRGRGVH